MAVAQRGSPQSFLVMLAKARLGQGGLLCAVQGMRCAVISNHDNVHVHIPSHRVYQRWKVGKWKTRLRFTYLMVTVEVLEEAASFSSTRFIAAMVSQLLLHKARTMLGAER